MNPNVKAKWLEALRSGEYEQGKEALYMQGQHCCLGVLCDIYAKETKDGRWVAPSIETHPWWFVCDEDVVSGDTELPDPVRIWAELPSTSGAKLMAADKNDWLTGHNDEGVPFSVLANAIEAQL